jgi:thioredoxin 2
VKCLNCGRSNRVPAARPGVPHCGVCGAALPWLAESSEADFHAVVEKGAIPVLVDFWAPWCGPCRIVSPIVEGLAEELAGRLKVVKVNTDTAPRLSSRFGIRGIPTLILFDHGKMVDRVTGALPADALRQWVIDHLPMSGQPSGVGGAQPGAA